jgi:CubicO group peptidase (beta-lactamase class C family)
MRQAQVLRLAFGCLALLACKKADEAPKPPPDPRDLPATIDYLAEKALAETGVPSAVVAAVVDGKIAYAHAYGKARLEPATPAALQMRYSIGSISKQFTAAAILLLAEEGKLTLDDAVGKYVPGLTRGDDITLRQILSHTSGYPDYAPQDYMIPAWQRPIDAQAILDGWARKPLEFEPGTKSQYSNTNFVIAGLVCEKVAGVPLFDFLSERVFKKLGMASVTNSDRAQLGSADAQGYFRRALGPLHPAPHEGPGWMYAAGELAMTVEDLGKWDVAVLQQGILSPASYRQLTTEVLLANGAGTRYGLGIGVRLTQGHRELTHSGEVSGFVAANTVLPDEKIAVAVLTNQDASGAAGKIADDVRDALLKAANGPSIQADETVKKVLADLADHRIDKTRLTDNAAAYFTDDAVGEFAQTLHGLGTAKSIEQTYTGKRGGMIARRYKAKYESKALEISVYETVDGKIEQFLIAED